MSLGGRHLLIVEDEAKLAAVLADYLGAEGAEVAILGNGSAVVAHVREHAPDLVLLDLMLPGMDGLSVCRALRGFSQVPIIMLTARVEEVDRLLGLELGADDYICKPFSPREVVARVRAVLRRAASAEVAGADVRLCIDEQRFEAHWLGRKLDLTPVEFRLLAALSARPGVVFSRDKLLGKLYQDHRVVSDRTVDSHVRNLRRKLLEVDADIDPLHSVYGVGYKFQIDI